MYLCTAREVDIDNELIDEDGNGISSSIGMLTIFVWWASEKCSYSGVNKMLYTFAMCNKTVKGSWGQRGCAS